VEFRLLDAGRDRRILRHEFRRFVVILRLEDDDSERAVVAAAGVRQPSVSMECCICAAESASGSLIRMAVRR
jgi:hypothetical protein